MKITEYPQATELSDSDILVVETDDGTRKVSIETLGSSLHIENTGGGSSVEELEPAVVHANTYRGKSLGNSYTDEQKAAIYEGTFEDLYIGDYWEINDIKWRIADINYWKYTGSSTSNEKCVENHVVVMPDTIIASYRLNPTGNTNAGYINEFYNTNLQNVREIVFSAFGQNNVMSHYDLLVNAVSNGAPSGVIWKQSNVDLPNQIMLIGNIAIPYPGTSFASSSTVNKTQFALFRMKPNMLVNKSETYWTRDIASSTAYVIMGADGNITYNGGATILGVRPVFAIK